MSTIWRRWGTLPLMVRLAAVSLLTPVLILTISSTWQQRLFTWGDVGLWARVWVVLGMTHLTIVSVTLYLHRSMTHQAVAFHPAVSHVFRLWLWLTTGMVTRQWVAVHRKHHAKVETVDDPHSPHIAGIGTILLWGADLYRATIRTGGQALLDRYAPLVHSASGADLPNDALENGLYTPYSWMGPTLLLALLVALFGPWGATMWVVVVLWIPITAAGVINGVGHYFGYSHFWHNPQYNPREYLNELSGDPFVQVDGKSLNIFPLGILIGGEELHHGHHAYPTSAKFSCVWWEFDLGWLYIRLLEILGLATVRRTGHIQTPIPDIDILG
jgi:stearoyl-CoA desaturase (delta-9 desaturase)